MIDIFLSGLFLLSALGILGGLFFLLGKLRAGGRAKVPVPADGGLWGTLLPALALLMLVTSTVVLMTEKVPAATPTLVVKLTGYQFGWRFDYFRAGPSIGDQRFDKDQLGSLLVSTTDHLVLPRGVDTVILATSLDIIHRLEVPEFRVRRDLIPGIVSDFRVNPPRSGQFVLLSDGLCGASLGLMAARVTVIEPEAFEEWLFQQLSQNS